MHRVYVHDGEIWTLASRFVRRASLPMDPERYVVYETPRPPSVQEVCAVIDGKHLCDFGPTHEHTDGY